MALEIVANLHVDAARFCPATLKLAGRESVEGFAVKLVAPGRDDGVDDDAAAGNRGVVAKRGDARFLESGEVEVISAIAHARVFGGDAPYSIACHA